jgi:hypothetical protein
VIETLGLHEVVVGAVAAAVVAVAGVGLKEVVVADADKVFQTLFINFHTNFHLIQQ